MADETPPPVTPDHVTPDHVPPFRTRLISVLDGEVVAATNKVHTTVEQAEDAIRNRRTWMKGMGTGLNVRMDLQAQVLDGSHKVVSRFVCVDVLVHETASLYGEVVSSPRHVRTELRWVKVSEAAARSLLDRWKRLQAAALSQTLPAEG